MKKLNNEILKCCLKFNNILVKVDMTQDYKKNRLLEPANNSFVWKAFISMPYRENQVLIFPYLQP